MHKTKIPEFHTILLYFMRLVNSYNLKKKEKCYLEMTLKEYDALPL